MATQSLCVLAGGYMPLDYKLALEKQSRHQSINKIDFKKKCSLYNLNDIIGFKVQKRKIKLGKMLYI